jgi:hypothetical protein
MATMSDPWYDIVAGTVSLTQGDLVTDCPILGWKENQPGDLSPGQPDNLARLANVFLRDVVVMTQACDLEHHKVSNVVLCPTLPLGEYKRVWEAEQVARHQNPTAKAWRKVCDEAVAGSVWNQAMLSGFEHSSARTEVRVVFFHEVYTLPRWFLESVLSARGQPRLRLRPPYREHLSQSFARFFMRVGLPQSIAIP